MFKDFLLTDAAPLAIYTLSLHDALPICDTIKRRAPGGGIAGTVPRDDLALAQTPQGFRTGLLREAYARADRDRKSTRLNSSHVAISYAVFCLKKKSKKVIPESTPQLPTH